MLVLAAENHATVRCQDSIYHSQFNSLIGIGRRVYGFASGQDKPAYCCVDLNSGTLRWTWQAKIGDGSAIAVDYRFVLWGQHGSFPAGEIDSRQVVASSVTSAPLLTNTCFAVPALHKGLLCARDEKRLPGLDLPRAK